MSEEKINGKSFVNLRLLKKIGIIGLSVSAAAVILVAVFSLLQSSGKSFTIRLDNPAEQPNLEMSSKVRGGDTGTYFVGDPILNASQAYGKKVYDRINKIENLEDLSGAQNLNHIDNDGVEHEDSQDAQVYTLYLTATGDEEEVFQASLRIDGLDVPMNVTNPLEYYRAMFITSDVTDSFKANENRKATVYGNLTKTQQATVLESDDYREAISSYSRVLNNEGRTVRKADESSNIEGQSYCEPFTSMNVNEELVRHEIRIPAKKTIRLTFVGYFEGFDPDAYGAAPKEAYMLLSLHFGK